MSSAGGGGGCVGWGAVLPWKPSILQKRHSFSEIVKDNGLNKNFEKPSVIEMGNFINPLSCKFYVSPEPRPKESLLVVGAINIYSVSYP